MKQNKRYIPFIPVATIEAAVSGDSIAMSVVLSKYRNYISRLAMKPVYEEEKGMVMYVDEYMRRQMHSKSIGTFRLRFSSYAMTELSFERQV